MRFKFSKNKFFIFLIAILVVLFINSYRDSFYQKKIKNFFYSFSSPIQENFWKAGIKISDFFRTISDINNFKKENENLKLKNQELLSKIADLEKLKNENEALRNALGVGLEKEFNLVMAKAISKDISNDNIEINKGLKDGISIDLPVITSQKILVGRVSEVYDDFSKVMLISNKNSSFFAKISGKEISGAVKGKGNFNIFLDLVSKEEEIKPEDIVVSSVLGGTFPEGLLVGKIKEVKKTDIETFQQAEIDLFLEISDLDELFIIVDF